MFIRNLIGWTVKELGHWFKGIGGPTWVFDLKRRWQLTVVLKRSLENKIWKRGAAVNGDGEAEGRINDWEEEEHGPGCSSGVSLRHQFSKRLVRNCLLYHKPSCNSGKPKPARLCISRGSSARELYAVVGPELKWTANGILLSSYLELTCFDSNCY